MDINYHNVDLFVQEKFERNAVEVWMIEKTVTGNYNIHYTGKDLVKTFLDPGMVQPKEVKPLLSFPRGFAHFLFNGLAESNAQKGIKTKDQNLIEGQLQATKIHLEDMRKFSEKLLDAVVAPPVNVLSEISSR